MLESKRFDLPPRNLWKERGGGSARAFTRQNEEEERERGCERYSRRRPSGVYEKIPEVGHTDELAARLIPPRSQTQRSCFTHWGGGRTFFFGMQLGTFVQENPANESNTGLFLIGWLHQWVGAVAWPGEGGVGLVKVPRSQLRRPLQGVTGFNWNPSRPGTGIAVPALAKG